MSGKPYPEGVSEVIKALARCDELLVVIRELESTVARLDHAKNEYEKLSREICIALQRMDLESQGNCGFGGRMGWFLSEMRRQIIAEAKAKP